MERLKSVLIEITDILHVKSKLLKFTNHYIFLKIIIQLFTDKPDIMQLVSDMSIKHLFKKE